MFIILVHWRIKPEECYNKQFLEHWKTKNVIGNRNGLVGEFLSDSLNIKDFPHITWNLDSESLGNFRSYVTIGLWKDQCSFEKEVGGFYNDNNPLEDFEKYRRRRVGFEEVEWRIGCTEFPVRDSKGVK